MGRSSAGAASLASVDVVRSAAVARVLCVTDEVPDAGLSGGNIRQYHLLCALAAEAETDLVLVGELRDEHLRGLLRATTELDRPSQYRPTDPVLRRARDLGVTLVGRQPFDAIDARSARRVLRRAMERAGAYEGAYDVVHLEHEQIAALARGRGGGRWVLTLQNVLSERSRQRVAVQTGARQSWVWRRDVERAKRLEQWALSTYDQLIVPSEEDARLVGPGVEVVPNGVDLATFTVTPLPAEPRLLLSGNMGYPPNVDGALWLANEIVPLVRQQVPDATLSLVGRGPVDAVTALGELPGVTVHPDVPSVLPYLHAARVALVPLRMGTGTRLKALEAMAAGRPLVGTSIGLEGLGLADGRSATIADDAAGLASGIVALLTDDDRARAHVAAARGLAESFGWDRLGRQFVDAVLGLPARTS
jgi:glycosyltransferase involved in cell wall biosynthesis